MSYVRFCPTRARPRRPTDASERSATHCTDAAKRLWPLGHRTLDGGKSAWYPDDEEPFAPQMIKKERRNFKQVGRTIVCNRPRERARVACGASHDRIGAMTRARVVALSALLATAACGGDEAEPRPPPDGGADAGPLGCKPGSLARGDGTCAPAGLPADAPCPPGEALGEAGACIPAGVPPEMCGDGFLPDGDSGCDPVLPAEPCPPGLIAVPGDAECREVAPCGAGTWGEIPVEPGTQHVDASYAAADGDGSAAKPWPTIQAGIAAAAPGAIVAVAAGSYAEDAFVHDKAVRLWGRCPELVEIVGTGVAFASLRIEDADGTEVRSLAIRGAQTGVAVTGSLEVLLDSALGTRKWRPGDRCRDRARSDQRRGLRIAHRGQPPRGHARCRSGRGHRGHRRA